MKRVVAEDRHVKAELDFRLKVQREEEEADRRSVQAAADAAAAEADVASQSAALAGRTRALQVPLPAQTEGPGTAAEAGGEEGGEGGGEESQAAAAVVTEASSPVVQGDGAAAPAEAAAELVTQDEAEDEAEPTASADAAAAVVNTAVDAAASAPDAGEACGVGGEQGIEGEQQAARTTLDDSKEAVSKEEPAPADEQAHAEAAGGVEGGIEAPAEEAAVQDTPMERSDGGLADAGDSAVPGAPVGSDGAPPDAAEAHEVGGGQQTAHKTADNHEIDNHAIADPAPQEEAQAAPATTAAQRLYALCKEEPFKINGTPIKYALQYLYYFLPAIAKTICSTSLTSRSRSCASSSPSSTSSPSPSVLVSVPAASELAHHC